MESSTPTFLDILLQGDGRCMGSSTSNVQMAFAILNEGRDVARPRSHYTIGSSTYWIDERGFPHDK
jgi:hypothetical protein